MISIELSRSGPFCERADWKRNGRISGHAPVSDSRIIEAISPVVSAIFLRTLWSCNEEEGRGGAGSTRRPSTRGAQDAA